MHKLRASVPSANYLFAFEAAARRLSFTEAAQELNVSQPAVSKTIRALEEACGMQLFRREKSRLSLTPEGERLFLEVQASFDRLHETITSLQKGQAGDVVRASFSSVFVTMWLLPRLHRFKARWPAIRLRIEESNRDSFDLEREQVDISGRLGYGDWPELTAWPFLREEIFPVCSPDYLARCEPIGCPADLLNHPLLHSEERHRKRVSWDSWMAAHGLGTARVPHDIVFTDNLAATQAALLGQGVALCWRHLVNEHLKAKRLVNPLGSVMHTDKILYLVAPANRPVGTGTAIFRDWLLEEMGELPHLIP